MALIPFHDLKKTIIGILNRYCEDYIIFKPTYYPLAKEYLDRLHKLKEADQASSGLLKTVFVIYTNLVINGSEDLATAVGLVLAKQLNIKDSDFLKYRESKIWTQRYIQGVGPFEAQVYKQSDNKMMPDIETDPVYNAYHRLNNQMELSKLMTENQVKLCQGQS